MNDQQLKQDAESQHDDQPLQDENESLLGSRFLIFNVMPSWLVSFIIHILLIIILAVAYWQIPQQDTVGFVAGEAAEDISDLQESLSFDSPEESDALETSQSENTNDTELQEIIQDFVPEDDFATSNLESLINETSAFDSEPLETVGATSGITGQVSGRSTAASRKALVKAGGGNDASENAVKLAMEWIKKHQLPNGSWSFDHRVGPNSAERASPNAGDFRNSPRAATALCLLVYLGAGQTHQEGDYQEVVEKGFAYLLKSGRKTSAGLSYYEDDGGLYNHGLAAIAICEVYAMTEDPRFAQAARDVIRYTEFCQDPLGGGWRYEPKQAGDTSAVGWQIMALKSATICGIQVDPAVIRKAKRFLSFVSSESGTFYGYTGPPSEGDRRKGVTSVGLLCQIYMGWSRENPALRRGCKWLGERGPSVGDWKPGTKVSERNKIGFRSGMYYNYYATQVMHQYGGPQWDEWNKEMRDFLIETQALQGPSRGSWFYNNPDEGGHFHGGRLYVTALAALTLEVYYRYLPLFDEKKVSENEFELD